MLVGLWLIFQQLHDVLSINGHSICVDVFSSMKFSTSLLASLTGGQLKNSYLLNLNLVVLICCNVRMKLTGLLKKSAPITNLTNRPWWPSGQRRHAISQLIEATVGPRFIYTPGCYPITVSHGNQIWIQPLIRAHPRATQQGHAKNQEAISPISRS